MSKPLEDPVPRAARSNLRFSLEYLDRSADPSQDFYRYATGGWQRTHPVPPDKPLWTGFDELRERNATLLRAILEECAARPGNDSERQGLGAFYRSAMDRVGRDRQGFDPIRPDLERVERLGSVEKLVRTVGRFHEDGWSALFETFVRPDRRASSVYALYFWQGGLALPDRDYYLLREFEELRNRYRQHVARTLALASGSASPAEDDASTVLALETALARASRTRAEQRDELRNYHRVESDELKRLWPGVPWSEYLAEREVERVPYVLVGQPEFLGTLATLLRERPLDEWKTYLRWHLLHSASPFLHDAAEAEEFDFFRRTLRGQKENEPIWRRAVETVDACMGEALGRAFVHAHFPPESRAKVVRLIDDLREVFTDRLRTLDWMGDETRAKALEKFRRFRAKVGHPEKFRDYTGLRLEPDDYLGNVRRSAVFESRRTLRRVGGKVDRDEWYMTPPSVNAYFEPTSNEIVFPAGILQPPFFDPNADDAVNYGGIGTVIGHEITHGYDDQGRRFDAEGNLNDWWSAEDAAEFLRRARIVVDEYSAVEPLPGVALNGELTLGENLADFGGVAIAYEALTRRLARAGAPTSPIEDLTPTQRFFLSYAQIWRANFRPEELRRRLAIDPHAPAPYRVAIPLRHQVAFRDAFGLASGATGPSGETTTLRIW